MEATGAQDRLNEIQARLDSYGEVLRDIAERVGGPRPEDSVPAGKWDMPLGWHVLHLGESIHGLRNSIQVLLGMIERVSSQLSAGASISKDNRDAIERLDVVCKHIQASALQIKDSLWAVDQHRPVLMRDLWWQPTETVEITLMVCLAGEATFFAANSEIILKSAMFQGIAMISANPAVWAIICGAIAVGSIVAYASRKRTLRRLAAGCVAVYFLATAILPMIHYPGALGPFHHALFGLGATWVLSRGPSNAL